MCGIFAVSLDSDKASNIILKGLKSLDYRGYDSWGIAVSHRQQTACFKKLGAIKQIKTDLPPAQLGIGHTRWATHGKVSLPNTHPHLDCTQKLSLVHNGMIENFVKIKKDLSLKHKFKSQTDSEVMVHLIEELNQTNSFLNSVAKAFKKIKGHNAFIILNSQTNQLIAIKKGSPLIIGQKNNQFYLASDPWAIYPLTKKIHLLKDNQLMIIKNHQAQLIDLQTLKKTPISFKKESTKSINSFKAGFQHFMLKEIYDQPLMLQKIACHKDPDIQTAVQLIKKSTKIYLLGCGSAYLAALFGQILLNQAGYQAQAVVASEFNQIKKSLQKTDLFLILSQSGETIDVLQNINTIKAKNIKIISLINVLNSSLFRKSDLNILLKAGQEKAVAATKSLTAKLAVLIKIYFYLQSQPRQARQLIFKAALAAADLLNNYQNTIPKLAQLLQNQPHLYILAKGLYYPLALEAALKIKEVAYLPAEAFYSGEFKHGPLALIQKNTPCLIMAPQNKDLKANLSAAYQLKTRGAYLIGLAQKKHQIFDSLIKIPDLNLLTVIPVTIAVQLLAYQLAVTKSLNPDKPRNLAKSVTVK